MQAAPAASDNVFSQGLGGFWSQYVHLCVSDTPTPTHLAAAASCVCACRATSVTSSLITSLTEDKDDMVCLAAEICLVVFLLICHVIHPP